MMDNQEARRISIFEQTLEGIINLFMRQGVDSKLSARSPKKQSRAKKPERCFAPALDA